MSRNNCKLAEKLEFSTSSHIQIPSIRLCIQQYNSKGSS